MSEKLIAYLQEMVAEAVQSLPGVTRRRTLVSDGWFHRGSCFTLVNRDARIVVRLDEPAAQRELLEVPGAEGWRVGARPPMRAWLLLPETFHDDAEAVAAWVKRAWAMAPQKKKGPAKKKVAAKAPRRARRG